MAYFVHSYDHRESAHFFWALLWSFALHSVVLTMVHLSHHDLENPATILDVELSPPSKPPAPAPEPLAPPPAPKPKVLPPKQMPIPRQLPLEPIKTVSEPLPPKETASEPPHTEPSPPAVLSAPQKPSEPQTFAAPIPEPQKIITPQDIDSARNNYGNQLSREFAKHKQYPRLAQMRGWQGTVQVQVQIDASGAVVSSNISKSSGYEVLDKQALEMVKKASPLPQPPEVLRSREFTVLVPVIFRLE